MAKILSHMLGCYRYPPFTLKTISLSKSLFPRDLRSQSQSWIDLTPGSLHTDHLQCGFFHRMKLCIGDWYSNGTPPQYSCLENPMDGGAWEAAVQGVTESRTQLSDFTFLYCCCTEQFFLLRYYNPGICFRRELDTRLPCLTSFHN